MQKIENSIDKKKILVNRAFFGFILGGDADLVTGEGALVVCSLQVHSATGLLSKSSSHQVSVLITSFLAPMRRSASQYCVWSTKTFSKLFLH